MRKAAKGSRWGAGSWASRSLTPCAVTPLAVENALSTIRSGRRSASAGFAASRLATASVRAAGVFGR
ncbi:hypothetical protein D3C87_1604380 [compost metagenome]